MDEGTLLTKSDVFIYLLFTKFYKKFKSILKINYINFAHFEKMVALIIRERLISIKNEMSLICYGINTLKALISTQYFQINHLLLWLLYRKSLPDNLIFYTNCLIQLNITFFINHKC